MASGLPAFTIVIHHPSANEYARLINSRFPFVRTIVAPEMDQVEQAIGDADVLLASRFPVECFDKARKLRWYQSTAAGVDSLLPVRDRLDHITITNSRGVHAEISADFVMGAITMAHWDFPRFLRDQAEHRWNTRYSTPLSGKTLGVVGLGAIGAAIAARAKGAGMTVVGTKRTPSPMPSVDRVFGANELTSILPMCDFVALALPSTQDNIGAIGAAELASMQPHAFLINIARGDVIVEQELIIALKEGVIAGAVLDVFEQEPLPASNPLWDMPNVIVTPHVAGSPADYVERVFSILADNIERFLRGAPLRNIVEVKRGY